MGVVGIRSLQHSPVHLLPLLMMPTSEKLCLQWNDFKENITCSFGELRQDKEFTDVTLVCEDGSQQIEAHKVVLASSSPFFMALLKKHKHPRPLIYMRGLRLEDLMAIMDFFYFGEANVLQENLDSFLALAEELKLKGLAGSAEAEKEAVKGASKRVPVKDEIGQKVLESLPQSKFDSPPPKVSQNTAVALTEDNISVHLQKLDEQIKTMFTRSDIRSSNGQGSLATCNVCGK